MTPIPTTVYFDTNIFDHLYKGIRATPGDVQFLKQRVSDGRLSILVSVINLEEMLMMVPSDRALAVEELQLMDELADRTHIIKPFHELIAEDITAYAQGIPLPSPLIVFPLAARKTLEYLRKSDPTDVEELIRETREQIDTFRVSMREGGHQVRQVARNIRRGDRPTFEQYWHDLSIPFAEAYAERPGQLQACRERGIEGLLQLRSVRLSVSASLSLTYAETFEKRRPQQGDSRDLQHALTASAVRVFVTHDPKFARLLKRVPVSDFRVLTLTEFLGSIFQ
jgi:hypothetical protein